MLAATHCASCSAELDPGAAVSLWDDCCYCRNCIEEACPGLAAYALAHEALEDSFPFKVTGFARSAFWLWCISTVFTPCCCIIPAILPAADAEQRSRFPSGRMSKTVVYPLLIAVAFLVFEITDDTGLGIAVACAKLGFGDLGTAFWLRRTDPDRLRGRTCFWFFLAGGLLKMLIGMFAVSMVLVLLNAVVRQAPGAIPAVFNVMFRGTSISIVLVALTGWTAIVFALHHDIKVWIDPTISEARRNRGGPPSTFTCNRAAWIAKAAFWLPVLTILVCLPTPFDLASVALAIVAYPLFTALVLRRICASMPFECWPMDEAAWSGHG